MQDIRYLPRAGTDTLDEFCRQHANLGLIEFSDGSHPSSVIVLAIRFEDKSKDIKPAVLLEEEFAQDCGSFQYWIEGKVAGDAWRLAAHTNSYNKALELIIPNELLMIDRRELVGNFTLDDFDQEIEEDGVSYHHKDYEKYTLGAKIFNDSLKGVPKDCRDAFTLELVKSSILRAYNNAKGEGESTGEFVVL